ncbi:MAG: ABC transporter ATP-binding protein [Candidatus Kapaibacterium sp.]
MSNKNDIIIEGKNITVSYGGRTIIKDVSFDVRRGEIFTVVGGSGSGKSTLLRQLIGLEYPESGEVYIDGEDFLNASEKERRQILRKFGVLFQLSGLLASMTIAENIALPLQTYTGMSVSRIAEIIKLKLGLVGLDGYQGYMPSELSGGMKKRAALARAMALDPDILFFDEPSSGLDPLTSASLDNLIREVNAGMGTTMFIVTHDLASVLDIGHRVIMLDKSTKGIIAKGDPKELQKDKSNEHVYNFFNRVAE